MTMQPPSRVRCAVVGVDGSLASLAAMRWAAAAVGSNGTVHAVCAVEPWSELMVAAVQANSTNLVSRAQRQIVSWVIATVPPEVHVVSHVIEKDTVPALLAVASDVEADLLAVGTHAAIAPFRTLGHVPAALVRGTTVPLALVGACSARAGITGLSSGSDRRSGFVVGVGRGASTEAAIDWAAAFARQHGRSLSLLRAIPHRPAFGPDGVLDVIAHYIDPSVLEAWAAEDLTELVTKIREVTDDDMAVDWGVRRGAVRRRLVEATAGSELLVVGRHDGFGDPTKSPILHYCLLHSSCPVVVVPVRHSPPVPAKVNASAAPVGGC